MKKILASVLALYSYVGAVQAGLIEITVTQSGTDVVFSGVGSVDLTGLGTPSPFNTDVNRSQFNFFGGLRGASDTYDITIPTFVSLNTDGFVFDSVSGDDFLVQGLSGSPPDFTGFLGVNTGYVSDTAIAFIWTVANETIAGLDLNFGTVAEFGGSSNPRTNTVTLIEGPPSPVSAPTVVLLLLTGVAGLRLVRRRRESPRSC